MFTELVPGNTIITGTPGGLGAFTLHWYRVSRVMSWSGDRGIRVLMTPVVGEQALRKAVGRLVDFCTGRLEQ
jgi:2-keto-4-pentenoate hydratase/2-oxohepta-3-ene-1,7-dioic acid hydratase in catechol pathway